MVAAAAKRPLMTRTLPLYSLLASITSTKLRLIHIQLDVRHFNAASLHGLRGPVRDFLRWQRWSQIDEILATDKRFENLQPQSVWLELLCSPRTLSLEQREWRAAIEERLPQTRARGTLG